jgi:hypothetical protein
MKEELEVLQEVVGTPRMEEENKTKKYVRIALTVVFMSFFTLLIVMAVLRRYGS